MVLQHLQFHIKISELCSSVETAHTLVKQRDGWSHQRIENNNRRGGRCMGAQLGGSRHLRMKSIRPTTLSTCVIQASAGRKSGYGLSDEIADFTSFQRNGNFRSQLNENNDKEDGRFVASPVKAQVGSSDLGMLQLVSPADFLCILKKYRIPTVFHWGSLLAIPVSKRFSTLESLAGLPMSAHRTSTSLLEQKFFEFGLSSGLRGSFETLRESGSNCFPRLDVSGNSCQFFINLLALALVGVVAQTPPSFGETLIESPGIARSVELPPLPTEYPDLGDIIPLSYEQLTLPNGLRVFLLEDHELGLVGGELLVRGGGKLEPTDKVGLAAMSAIIQRSGGSQAHPAEELDSMLEVMAARIEASSSVSEMTVGFRCLTEDLDTVFSLYSEVVQEPLMPQDKLDFTRSQFLGGIARRPDDAGGIAAREFNKLLYGSVSVYARVPEISTVTAISRDDLLAFHHQNFRPEKGVLGIWGDFDSKTVKKMVENQFGGWTVATQGATTGLETATPLLESGFSASAPSIYVIDRPGLTQGYVRMGEFGTTLADADVFALDVLNGILNGFGGLLFDEVRSREGLAYSVSGGWSPAVEHRGAFIAGGETRIQAIPQFVQAVQRVLNSVTSNLADADSLARAKEAALNSFVFNFTDSGAQLVRVLSYELFDIDQDFLFRYKKGVEATTALDVLKAAQCHLHANAQPILIVTDAEQLPPLSLVFDVPVISLRPNYSSNGQ